MIERMGASGWMRRGPWGDPPGLEGCLMLQGRSADMTWKRSLRIGGGKSRDDLGGQKQGGSGLKRKQKTSARPSG